MIRQKNTAGNPIVRWVQDILVELTTLEASFAQSQYVISKLANSDSKSCTYALDFSEIYPYVIGQGLQNTN